MFGFGKGKIEVKLEKFNFKPGETIKGKVLVKMKKPTKARALKVIFLGTKTNSSGVSIGGGVSVNASFGSKNRQKQKTTTEIIHKFEMPLDGEKEYSEAEYPFEILVPADILSRGSGPGGNLGTAVQAIQFLSGNSARIDWSIQAVMDIEGSFDVNKKLQVNIG